MKKRLLGMAFAGLTIILLSAFLLPMLQREQNPVLSVGQLVELPEQDLMTGTEGNLQLNTNYVYYEGKRYCYNYDLYNVLFMGIDKIDTVMAKEIIGTAGQADSIILLSFDKAEKKAWLLQISRDTMTDIDIYDTAGKIFATSYGQLALQHAFAPGGESSSWAMKQTVKEILFDLQIDAYVVLDIQGLPIINDEIGGVEITFSKDYSDLDEAFQPGASILLDGKMAETFVRKRDILLSGSNSERMERQNEYIYAFFKTLKKRNQEERLHLDQIQKKAEAYLTTDIRLEEIEELISYDYSLEDIVSLPGEIRQGDVYEEFYMDDEALKQLLIDMFYEPVS